MAMRNKFIIIIDENIWVTVLVSKMKNDVAPLVDSFSDNEKNWWKPKIRAENRGFSKAKTDRTLKAFNVKIQFSIIENN